MNYDDYIDEFNENEDRPVEKYKIEEDKELDTQEDKEWQDNEDKISPFLKSAFDWIDSFVVSLLVVIMIFTIFLGKVRVEGPSMEDTLHSDDQLIITDFNYTPKVGDVVIVSRNPENSTKKVDSDEHQPIVKRVIAVAGDSIEIKDEKVYVNDVEIDEPYIKGYAQGFGTDNKQFQGKQIVPEGRVFVMGDNRYNSHDSRSLDIYFVDRRYILGKVMVRIFPFDQIDTF